MRVNGFATRKFNIIHIFLWMPITKPSLKVESEINFKLVKQFYFDESVCRTMFQPTEIKMT